MYEAEIIPYQPEFGPYFKSISYAWLEKYFGIEDADRELLENHREKILDQGGHILFARFQDDIVGTCALINHGNGIYELAKLGVIESHQGKKIGEQLVLAIVDKARSLNASHVVLESSSELTQALGLYRKLGFEEGENLIEAPFSRCNVQLSIKLKDNETGN